MKNLLEFQDFINENIYVGLYKNNKMVGALMFNKIEDIETDYVDNFHDNGIVLKSITKSEYDNFDEGDELTLDDIKSKNYRIE